MSWVDYVVIVAMAFYLLEGIRRGFIEQLLELFGFVISTVAALLSYHFIASWLIDHIGVKEFMADPAAFFLGWFLYQVAYSVILRLTYPLIPASIRKALPNRVAGILPALMKGIVILSLILMVTVSLPVPERLKSEINNSRLGSRLVQQSGSIQGYLEKRFGGDIGTWFNFITVPAKTERVVGVDERVDLQFTYDQGTVDRESEQRMLTLINEERKKAGLPTLTEDSKTTEVARAHSQGMLVGGYFSHTNLKGQSPFDRMEAIGITFHVAGENLAKAANVDLAHSGLMRSPGHKANILGKDFRKIGIGAIDAGIYGKMFTQDFTD